MIEKFNYFKDWKSVVTMCVIVGFIALCWIDWPEKWFIWLGIGIFFSVLFIVLRMIRWQ